MAGGEERQGKELTDHGGNGTFLGDRGQICCLLGM